MKLFLLQRVENLAHNWHSEGGLVVVAEDLAAAKAAIVAEAEPDYSKTRVRPEITDEEWASAVVYDVGDVPPASYYFPDAGCC